MHLLLLGISHRTAPVDLRERVDFQTRGVVAALDALAERRLADECVVLSTCNRAEIYCACDVPDATRAGLLRFLSEYHGVALDTLEPHLYTAHDLDVARHLFRVAAGLDSLVVGEPQVLGQVKDAHAQASGAGRTGPVLHRAFQSAFSVGKRVRTETELGAGAVSVGFAAVALARKIFGSLSGCNVLVVGAGDMGKLTARHMQSQGVRQVTIVSRTLARATHTASALGGAHAAGWDDLASSLADADIVISATGASTPILTRASLEPIMRARRNRPLFVIDIALPRDVEPAVGEIEQVFLFNLDDLQSTVQENLARRTSEVQKADALVTEALEAFAAWLRARSAVPTIVALRQHFERVRRAELQRLTMGLEEDRQRQLDDLTRLLFEKVLLAPTEQLKALDDPDKLQAYGEALTRVFGIGDSAGATEATPAEYAPGRVKPFARPRRS